MIAAAGHNLAVVAEKCELDENMKNFLIVIECATCGTPSSITLYDGAEKAVTQEATCVLPEISTLYCEGNFNGVDYKVEKTGVETGAALGHTEEIIPAVEATCTENGLTEGKKCSVCEEVLTAQEEVAALGHTEVIDAAVEPTYTTTGLTEGKHCSVCEEVLVAQTEVPAYAWPTYTVEKVSSTRGKVTFVETENSKAFDDVMVKVTWRYTYANGDTISVTINRIVKEDGTFKTSGVDVPSGATLNFVYAEVVIDEDADEKERGAYEIYGYGMW